MQKNQQIQITGISLLALFCAMTAQGAGYHFGSQSASNQGVANAGAAAVYDASTLFYNPAGLTRLDHPQWSVITAVVAADGQFNDTGSTATNANSTVPATSTGNGAAGRFLDPAFVPHLYYARPINSTLDFGVGITVPFGAKVAYDENWTGRYNIVDTELKTLDINPSIAWKSASGLSLGGGISGQWMQGHLYRKVNYGAAALMAATNPAIPGNLQPAAIAAVMPMFANPAYDGTIDIEGQSWAMGFNLGALYEWSPSTRLGLAYRSSVHHRLQGKADWTVAHVSDGIASALGPVVGNTTAQGIGAGTQAALASAYPDSDASVKIDTPESASLSFYTEPASAWALMADITWTAHSRFQEMRIDFESVTPDSVTVEHWTDTWRYAIGGSWQANDRWLWKAGVAYEESPVNDQNRTASLPDSNRTWLSLGLRYQHAPNSTLDLAWSYIRLADGSISHTDDADGETPCACSYATLRGDYRIHSHLLAVQYTRSF